MFKENLNLIDNTLITIVNDSFDSTSPESIKTLKKLGESIERDYLGSISLSKTVSVDSSRHSLEESHLNLSQLISSSSNVDLERYLSYFYTHFLLTNEAEKANIVAVNASRDNKALNTGIPKAESIENAIQMLYKNGKSPEEVQKIIDKLSLELVFTAHPTEAKSDLEIILLQQISQTLRSKEGHKGSELLRITKRLMSHINPNTVKPTVLEEVDRNLVYFDYIYNVIPKVRKELKKALEKYFPSVKITSRPVVKYSSWVGGDRDGHPGVTSEVHYKTAKRHHNQAIENHITSLEDLETSTSNSTEKSKIKSIINKLEIRLLDPNKRQNSYNKSFELIEDLKNLELTSEVSKSMVEDLITNVEAFGFHLAQIDTREHSKKHEEALSDIFSYNEVQNKLKNRLLSLTGLAKESAGKLLNGNKYETLSKDEKMAFLSSLIADKEIIDISSILKTIDKDDWEKNNTSRVIRTFQQVKKIQEDFSPDSATVQITSFTHDESDVLEAIFLAKEAELVTVKDDGSIDSKLDFMPLFETIEDLNNCDVTLSSLFKNDTYKKVLASRKNNERVFLGYSDGTKDGGYAAAYGALWNAPNKIRNACIESNIPNLEWEVFHGRGGSLGRGGGKAGEAISSQAPNTILSKIRITEQGEFLSFRYSDEEMAFRHLEVRLEALIRASANFKTSNSTDEKKLLKIGDVSFSHYRKLFEAPKLRLIIEKASPYICIQFSNWGSRPANRWDPSANLNLEQLRAIPWVVTWNQIRMMVPGWYGMGLAINEMLNNESITLDELKSMHRDFDAFRIMVDHCEMALAKSNMHAASLYGNLLPENSEERNLFNQIMDEHLQTTTIINKIKNNNRLLDKNPTIQNRIDERNSYTHILNYIQVKLLKDLFSQLENDSQAKDLTTQETLKLCILSMKGIAAALQETG